MAIRVDGISKLYRLGTGSKGYKTLRESFGELVTAPFRRRDRHSASRSTSTADDLWALDGVTFDVSQGEVVGIIGRNGAGKSTLLKVLSGITEPTLGEAEIFGRVGSLLEVGSGFHPELTGRENVYLNGAILGMRRAEIARKFDEIIAFAEVERFVDTPVKRYSSGMYLRLAFAVAAHLEPEILVVDEVLAVGDVRFQAKCLAKMRDVSGQGRTVLFVSHNMGAVHRLCSRCLLLDRGNVVFDGTPAKAIDTYVSDGLHDTPEIFEPPDPDKPVALRRARTCTTAGRLTSEFRYDEDVVVQVEYEVNRPLAGCSVWFGLYSAENQPVLGTSDTDSRASSAEAERYPGYYRTEVRLPGRWLNAGRYQLVVGIARLGGNLSYSRVELTTLTILDVGLPEPGRPGVLQPTLEWHTALATPPDESASAAVAAERHT